MDREAFPDVRERNVRLLLQLWGRGWQGERIRDIPKVLDASAEEVTSLLLQAWENRVLFTLGIGEPKCYKTNTTGKVSTLSPRAEEGAHEFPSLLLVSEGLQCKS